MSGGDFGGFERVLRVGEGRRLKRLRSQAEYIGTLEPEFEKLSDEELKGKTAEFRQRVANGETLEDILFEAFATVREAFKRTMGVRLFDVQMMGGIVLHEGDIAEMRTGEGKTFVATMPLYLNSLTGQNVHLVTVNDYLAKRDPEWVKPVYDALGVRAGFIRNLMPFAERTDAYSADITYGTNAEFGFDYLRDNMAVTLEGTVQRGYAFAIVDEVDSILIDEARTPLIISGEPETAAQVYYDFARVVKGLAGERSKQKSEGKGIDETERSGADYLYDEKFKTVSPAQSAIDKIERALGIENLYDARNMQFVNHLNQALKAQALFLRDRDYVVQDGEVKIVDEFTGRIMEGRRWSEGLHQAVEAKEGVAIQEENVTLATITLQNYFRLYEKLAGMTGTAKTEEKEFVEIYNLHVVEIPTNVDVARDDKNDYIFKTKEAKYDAVLDDIEERHEKGQPVLVGTISVEVSEHLSQLLQRRGHPAQRPEREAARARGRDHQGRGSSAARSRSRRTWPAEASTSSSPTGSRSSAASTSSAPSATRRGASTTSCAAAQAVRAIPASPGSTCPGTDDLVRLFAGDRIHGIMERFKVPDDQPMESGLLSKQVENAQKKVEEQNFVSRKNVLKYDDVLNTQREVIYAQRRQVLEGADLSEEIKSWVDDLIERLVDAAHRGRVRGGLGPRRARPGVQRADGRGRHGRGAARGHGRDHPRGADRGLPRRGARAVRGEGEALGRRGRARGRAVHRARGGRHALARAPREHGLPPRGRSPAGVRAEGSARRVPRRGARRCSRSSAC